MDATSTPKTPRSDSADYYPETDGAAERLFRRGQSSSPQGNVAAIFVHAGAGYHSTTNEHIHLGACDR